MKSPVHYSALLAVAALLTCACGKKPEASPAAETPAVVLGDVVLLDPGFPPELIEGTPSPANVPNLLPAPNKAPDFRVPAGSTLLSGGKPVSSSDDAPIIGDLSLITDGDKDAGEGYYVELLNGLQWVQIDLGQVDVIDAIWIWHFHAQKRAYHDVIVQISDDPTFASGVTTLYNNDYDHSAKLGKGSDRPYIESRFGLVVDAKGQKARYVRVYSNGNSSNEMNHYTEVEVFGRKL